MTATHDLTELFVNGTLMRGLALHGNLRGADYLGEALTAPWYRIHTIGDVHPGIYRVATGGVRVPGELYLVSEDTRAHILATEPPNLYLGPVELDDGRTVEGVLYPEHLARVHPDISVYGGWRAYQELRQTPHLL